MICNEKTVSDALAYLAEDPHPFALARYDLDKAEAEAEGLFGQLYLRTEGTVDERKSVVQSSDQYRKAKMAVAAAQYQQERHRRRCKAAEMICEIWRTEQANIRAAESIR